MRGQSSPIRVLPVDDSPTLRRLIAAELSRHADIECLQGAAHALEAREMIKALDPDVLILDIAMPHMSGLDFLRKVMSLRPMPVLMFSSLTRRGSRDAVEALSIGAVHCLGKSPDMAKDGTLAALPELVRMAAAAHLPSSAAVVAAGPRPSYQNRGRIICLGASTGGVDALGRVLSAFPEQCPPTLITQHMPHEFLRSFAARLNGSCAPHIALAEDGAPLLDGTVHIAPGGPYHLELAPGTPPTCRLVTGDKVSGHRPSVDVLYRSAVPLGKRVVAAILTGMGSDGAAGMRDLAKSGATCVAQDEDTCVVFGMPKVALSLGGATRALPLDDIAPELLRLCAEPKRSARLTGAAQT